MKAYLDLLHHVITHGRDREDRTGVGTRAVFGYQFRHDLRTGFPLLTTKRVHVKSIIHELLWFLRGETNVRSLQEAGVTIWDEWADEAGELGPVYGKQWRDWGGYDYESARGDGPSHVRGIDQVFNLVRDLRSNPFSRRHIVTAWNPADVPIMALPPCHTLWQCQVETGLAGVPFLHLHLYARSIDSFLGLPFNIASYALLLSILARTIGAVPGELVISFGDLHIYRNHFDQVAEQLSRQPRALPELIIEAARDTSIDGYLAGNFRFADYNPHPAIKAPVAV